MNKLTRGFTLIELMIVVAVIAIIVAIGYPSYLEQVKKTRRAEGMGQLLELADRLERHYSDVGSYKQADGSDTTAAGIYVATTDRGYYNLAITAQDNVAFTITATPTSLGGQDEDGCGTFTYTSLGNKSVSGSLASSKCWR